MSQLASAARPARTARQLARLRDIKKVEGAIRWHERERKKRKDITQDRWEAKQAHIQRRKWEIDNVKRPIRDAKKNLTEDYLLGPLRPNRAVGQDAPRYGVLGTGAIRRPNIPTRVQEKRNEFREQKGLELEYPLVVDGKKYFHIVEYDRVVVVNGREKGKIGTVDRVVPESHEVIIKDINKHYVDGRAFNVQAGENPGAKREVEVPIPIEDVRLVIPYRMPAKAADGVEKYTYQDVVVDKLIMERHTTGKDPFTGIDYGNYEFPEEHRFDPMTGLPIFNRYVAGTRRRIQWPWEDTESYTTPKRENERQVKEEQRPGAIGMIKHPIKSLKSLLAKRDAKNDPKPNDPQDKDNIHKIDDSIEQAEKSIQIPQGQPVNTSPDWDDDTGRSKADVTDHTRSFYPTLVYPPFPNDIPIELRSDIRQKHKTDTMAEREKKNDTSKDKEDESVEFFTPSARERAEKELAKLERKRKLVDSMKTPLQLRWEVERAKKLEQEKAHPKVDREALLAALGQHMWTKGATKKTREELGKAEALD